MVHFAYILAGGRSKRFGSDKGLVRISGEPLLKKLASQVAGSGLDVSVVCRLETDYVSLGLRCLADRVQDGGPLAGLATALEDCQKRQGDACLMLTCDLVNWHDQWLASLQHGWSETAEIATLASDDFLPFPGLYRTSLLLRIQNLWNQGDRSLRSLHQEVGNGILKVTVPECGLPKTFNTPEEFEKLRSD